ncbi:hypothetical protein [Phytohabitans kaempferiae]|uniref:HTH-type transcriptional repressor KstR2 C-terminal domain-containing protein n=1 Tax=Phytohabitans kaempferiae TaxID=1620943 RepID=A0ABV6MAE2_9ACTN
MAASGRRSACGPPRARWYRDGGDWTAHDIAEEYGELALRMLTSKHRSAR